MNGFGLHPVQPTTRIIPMIGHPIAQVKSLAPVNAWLAANGHDASMVPMDLMPERVSAFFDCVRGWDNCIGVSITLPHKQAALAACDILSDRAAIARAVNIIRRGEDGRLHGDMTDGIAFCAALAAKGVAVRGTQFLLIGAGGAGGAVAHAMAGAGAGVIIVTDIDRERSAALIAGLRREYPELTVYDQLPPHMHPDIGLNATPLGMKNGDPLPFDITRLAPHALVADAVTMPVRTPWLLRALELGHPIQTGEDLALAQLSIQLPIWGFEYRRK